MANFENLLIQNKDHVALITFNRPEKLNALSKPMTADFMQALDDISRDDDIRVIVITGAGRAFCAGHDMYEGGGKALDVHMGSPEQSRQEVRRGQKLINVLRGLEKPIIAMVNGPAVGGGFDLSLGCDMRVGSENARFRSYTHMGLSPTLGGAWFLPRIIGVSKAAEVFFTGDFVGAEQAHEIGLLDRLVPAEDLEAETMALAGSMAKSPPVAVRLAKMLLYRGLEINFETYLAIAASSSALAGYSDDHKEAVASFREKRKPEFKGW